MLGALGAGPAIAQTTSGTAAPSLLIPLEPPPTSPASGMQDGCAFNFRPLGVNLGRTLADHGVNIVAKGLPELLGKC